MTDKEKAWAYDGALNRAKAAIDNAADKALVKGVVTAIFPLLREGQENNVIDIPFGAHDSELKGWEYTIPEGFTAEIKDRKVLFREKESEDERIRKELIGYAELKLKYFTEANSKNDIDKKNQKWWKDVIAYLEKQKKQKPISFNEPYNPDDYEVVIEGNATGLKRKEQKPNYCHHEVDETGWTEEYRKAYYDGWNNCNMQHSQLQAEQKPAEWSEEDERNIRNLESILYYDKKLSVETRVELGDSPKSLRPQPREEIYQAAKHVLAIKFMNYLDENRPEGKISLSNGECEDIDKAFKENDWAKILRYAEKYGK